MQLVLKNSDILRIGQKLNDVKHGFKEDVKDIRLQWRLDILKGYTTVVQSAMGSVLSKGGYVRMSFMTAKGNEYWKGLAPSTVLAKAKRRGYTQDPDEIVRSAENSAVFSIWLDTGQTKKAVGIYPGVQGASFAGITQVLSAEAFAKAFGNEFGEEGKKIPQRRLFEVANTMFAQALHGAMANPDSELAQKLRNELIRDIFIGKHRWGKKR